jgi:4-amino-4-deoxy-L-arabinose transferase-like glycosyltransferase
MRRELTYLLIAAWLGLFVRVLAVFFMGNALGEDPDAYQQLAQRWAATNTFALAIPETLIPPEERADGPKVYPTAFRPPLYPLILSVLLQFGMSPQACVVSLHLILGMATCGLTYSVARYWIPPLGSLLAALLVAVDPLLIFQSVQIMTETLATLLGLSILLIWVRTVDQGRSLGFWWTGLILGLAILCRPPFLLWAPCLAVLTAASTLTRPGLENRARMAGWNMAVLTLATILVVTPWVYRNWRVFGEPHLTTTHGGYTLLLANNPSFYEAYQRGERMGDWRAETPEFQAILQAAYPEKVGSSDAEQARDEAYSAAAWKTIQSSPGLFIQTSFLRLSWFWSPWPHGSLKESKARSILRGSIAVFYLLEFGCCLIAITRFRNWSRSAQWCFLGGLFLALTLSGLHMIYWSNMRMRAPLVPLLAILAVFGATTVLGFWRDKPAKTGGSYS